MKPITSIETITQDQYKHMLDICNRIANSRTASYTGSELLSDCIIKMDSLFKKKPRTMKIGYFYKLAVYKAADYNRSLIKNLEDTTGNLAYVEITDDDMNQIERKELFQEYIEEAFNKLTEEERELVELETSLGMVKYSKEKGLNYRTLRKKVNNAKFELIRHLNINSKEWRDLNEED